MFPINKYSHLFYMISEFILAAMTLVFFIFGIKLKKNKKEIVWICSKIETVNKILENNSFITPITNFSLENSNDTKRMNDNYTYNILSSFIDKNGKCKNGYSQCGILDSYGNIMCIPDNQKCPINNIEFNYNNKNDKTTFILSNTKINNSIIIYITLNNDTKYINELNFILDSDSFKYYYKVVYNSTINFYGNNAIKNYIKEKFKEKNNIDKNFKEVGKLYYRNYIGFKNSEDILFLMKEKDNLKRLYKVDFPNIPSTVMAIISLITLLVLIIVSLTKFFAVEKRKNKYVKYPELKSKLAITGIYLAIFIGYLTYLIYICVKLSKNNRCCKLKKIKSEEFIQNHIKEICDVIILKGRINISGLVILPFSLIVFIIGLSFEELYLLWLKINGRRLDLQWITLKKKYKITS